jgi:isocitrate dehydrogenase
MKTVPITIARGDGIGPEIMAATLNVLEAAGAKLAIEEIEIGEQVYLAGNTAGISPEAWDSLRRTRVFLKSPITTPQGGGYKSLNVTIRKTLGLFANVRPCVSYHPFVASKHPTMNVVIIRENEEDTYAGIEHQQTDDVVQCLKLISRPGCERICRYAFEYAVANQRQKVTCLTKDNIMKLTDGLFHKVFNEIAAEYPQIKNEHRIVDIGTARLATAPEEFDVIVTPNLYGDIISDVTAEMTGSVGMAGSANIGRDFAMFEAIHGSAPDIAGQGIANPSGLLHGAIMMLVHIGQAQVAERIHNAWLRTLEDGIHTGEISSSAQTRHQAGTQEFAAAIIARLGQIPQTLPVVRYKQSSPMPAINVETKRRSPAEKKLVGVDVFIHQHDISPDDLAHKLERVSGEGLEIKLITNRGVKVWPGGFPETFCTDHWRCRFKKSSSNGYTVTHDHILALLGRIRAEGLDFIKTENLCYLNGEPAFTLGQGE